MPQTASPQNATSQASTSKPLSPGIEQVFAAQLAYAPTLARSSARERIARLRKLHKALLERRQEFRDAMMADFRKHPTEVDLTEIFPVTSEIRHTTSHLAEWMKPVKADAPLPMLGTSAEIRYQARGVCLIISPWNFPINLTLIPLVSAIAAGNAVVLKTSELSPNTSRALGNLIRDVFDLREVALFEGDATVAQELLRQPFHHIFFTGSPAVGKLVMKAAAEHLASITLELGGKSPVLVHESANLEEVARKVAWGKFINNGQICLSPDYVLVPEALQDTFVSLLERQIGQYFGGSEAARKQSTSYCRIVNDRHFARLKRLMDDALERGATAAIGGTAVAEERFISPTVLTGLTDDMAIMQEEIFGPLLPVLAYTELDDALHYINQRPRPLALYCYTGKSSVADYVLERTHSGGACINDNIVQFFNPNIPFGGVNNSGMGQSHGIFGFQTFSHARGVVRQHTRLSSTKLMYPPYSDNVDKLVDLSIKLF
jgi:aldehyde dehydrogenase (NAD+)